MKRPIRVPPALSLYHVRYSIESMIACINLPDTILKPILISNPCICELYRRVPAGCLSLIVISVISSCSPLNNAGRPRLVFLALRHLSKVRTDVIHRGSTAVYKYRPRMTGHSASGRLLSLVQLYRQTVSQTHEPTMSSKVLLTNALVASLAHAVVGGITHYPPNITNINSIEFVLNGTGAPGMFLIFGLVTRLYSTDTSVLHQAYTTHLRLLPTSMASTTGAICPMFAPRNTRPLLRSSLWNMRKSSTGKSALVFPRLVWLLNRIFIW